MPPSTLQARIRAFEAIGTGASKEVLEKVAIHSEPEPEHLLDRPHSPTAASIPHIVPTTYSPSASPSPLDRTSLLDLKDWVIDDGPLHVNSTTTILSDYSPQTVKPLPHESAPLISFDGSPPKSLTAPPLPLRKLSFNTPRPVSAPAASPTLPRPSPSNNMLMLPDAHQPYPLTPIDFSPSDSMRRAQGHVPASSISSFHSVSLSDGDDFATPGALRAFPMEREWTGTGTEDGESLDESFEDVSAPSFFLPPITLPPRPQKPPGQPALAVATPKQPAPQPPKLPQRPGSSPSPVLSGVSLPVLTRIPSPSSSSLSLPSTRRVPPPPPVPPAAPPHPPLHPRSRPPSARTSVQSTTTTASDRSSVFSQSTTTSRTSASSRASVSASAPASSGAKQVLAARARYDALFLANVRALKPPPPMPAKRQNAGWRGLSIDIKPGAGYASTSARPVPEPGNDGKLDGRVVREIWLKSRLEPQRLRDIWCVNECDRDNTGSLDPDAFARGMARIDEELRRAQVLGRSRTGSGMGVRTPQPVPSRLILR
ncbi:hypothetical protein F5148DRAFT_975722 [Russula earlei]|uniref:Uncharacterized protein n=1 Tax=Russula earlei TaxID=71964 RepID=A0ACC0UHI3_9AGAM|nr:hypothetical protein F5148DRAFT_975722 [Russula earlei]